MNLRSNLEDEIGWFHGVIITVVCGIVGVVGITLAFLYWRDMLIF
jgi:hypothetical protein